MRPSDLPSQISAWIKERVIQAGAQGIVLGMSGGVDSSVTAGLSKKPFLRPRSA